MEQSTQVGGEGAEASESWRPYPPPSVAGEAVGWERVQAPGRRSSERRGSTAGVGGGVGWAGSSGLGPVNRGLVYLLKKILLPFVYFSFTVY